MKIYEVTLKPFSCLPCSPHASLLSSRSLSSLSSYQMRFRTNYWERPITPFSNHLTNGNVHTPTFPNTTTQHSSPSRFGETVAPSHVASSLLRLTGFSSRLLSSKTCWHDSINDVHSSESIGRFDIWCDESGKRTNAWCKFGPYDLLGATYYCILRGPGTWPINKYIQQFNKCITFVHFTQCMLGL